MLPISRVTPSRSHRWVVRTVVLVVLVIISGFVGYSHATDEVSNAAPDYFESADQPPSAREPLVGERSNATAIATRGNQRWLGTDALYVLGPSGRLQYLENRSRYADVDPSPAGRQTLLVAADTKRTSDCNPRCSRQYVRRINYSTGETTDLYEVTTPGTRDSNWHDIDRVGDGEYLVASIHDDSVYRLDIDAGVRRWSWSLQSTSGVSSGGPYPADWAHINDVDRLPDGRIMVSARNQDQVLFIHPERGVQENWTLGCDDCFETLYEQHNPDYIPASQGGPAVVVADSENNRVVEYQRVNGSWRLSWVWQDDRMDWPRDADRLPNGNTLITDTHENRVIEVNRSGAIVWQAHVPIPYEAERLGTGDESQGGPSAQRANLTNVTSSETTAANYAVANEGERTPLQKLWHGLQFMLPPWMGFLEVGALFETVVIVVVWLTLELRWRGWRLHWPVARSGDA